MTKKTESAAYTAVYSAASSLLGEIASDVYQTFLECDDRSPSKKQFGEAIAECALEQALWRKPGLDKLYAQLSEDEIDRLEKQLAKAGNYYLN